LTKTTLGFLEVGGSLIVCLHFQHGISDVRDWQTAGALQQPPHPRVADRGTPSRVDKRVVPDRENAADKQCQGEGKL